MGYLWTWAENQVLVAMKAVPIGQSAGQRVLLAMGRRSPQGLAAMDSGEGRHRAALATRCERVEFLSRPRHFILAARDPIFPAFQVVT